MRDLFAFQLHELINSSGERVFSQLTREMLFRRLSRVSVVNRYLLSKVKIPRSYTFRILYSPRNPPEFDNYALYSFTSNKIISSARNLVGNDKNRLYTPGKNNGVSMDKIRIRCCFRPKKKKKETGREEGREGKKKWFRWYRVWFQTEWNLGWNDKNCEERNRSVAAHRKIASEKTR